MGAWATATPIGSDTVPISELRSFCADRNPMNASEQYFRPLRLVPHSEKGNWGRSPDLERESRPRGLTRVLRLRRQVLGNRFLLGAPDPSPNGRTINTYTADDEY